MLKAFKSLGKAWASLVDSLDAVHDDESWQQLDGDTRTQLLICMKEMSNALGHAQDEARRAGVTQSRRVRNRENDDVRADDHQVEINEAVAKARAQERLSPQAQKRRASERRARSLKKRRKGRKR